MKYMPWLVAVLMGAPTLSRASDPTVANARQIPAVLSTLTGIPYERSDIATYYGANSSRFPQLGTLNEVTATFLLAQISYASLFCKDLVAAEQAKPPSQRWVFASIDFARPLTQLGDPARAQSLFNDLSQQFWSRTATADEAAVLAQEMQSWAQASDAVGAGRLELALTSFCAATLAAPQTWLEPQ